MKNIINYLSTLVFMMVVLLFFGWWYPYHVTYHEQFQMFLFTPEYFVETVSVPGGLADYIGRFFTQFFFYSWAGSVIIAVLLGVIQWGTWLNLPSKGSYPLSFLPAVVLWIFLCDESAMPAVLIAYFLASFVGWGVAKVSNIWVRRIVTLMVIPLLYMAIGPMALLFVLIQALKERSTQWGLGAMGAYLLVFLLCPLCAQYMFPYPLIRLFMGIHYFRFPEVQSYFPLVAVIIAIVTLVIQVKRQWIHGLLAVGVCLVAAAGIYLKADFEKEEVMGYDFMARTRMWNSIIRTANVKAPSAPTSVSILNLALAQKEQMGDHMFDYYQNGGAGMFPTFVRDFFLPLSTSEALYYLGMTYEAQQYTYEAMEAIPDFQKSSRCYKRLAETNMIHGDYVVARKYLRALQHTLLYSKWATETLTMLDNEDAINKHPEYGMLRQFGYKDDFYVSDNERTSMLGQLFLSNRANRMAYEYLMGWTLLNGDLENLPSYFSLSGSLNLKGIPVYHQQALVLAWALTHPSPEGMPWPIASTVLNGFNSFVQAQRQNTSAEQMKARFGRTYWYYYFYSKS